MNAKKLVAIIAALVVMGGGTMLFVAMMVVSFLPSIPGVGQNASCVGAPTVALKVDTASLPKVRKRTPQQMAVAAQIMKVGEQSGVGERGQLIGLMTAMQESDLGAMPTVMQPNSDGDAGVFQQRVLPGWYGTLEQVTDPATGAKIFFEGVTITKDTYAPGGAGPVGYHIPGLKNISGWESMSLTQAAQSVQKSAYPDAYAKHEAEAREIMAALAGVPVTQVAAGSTDAQLGCGGGALPAVNVASGIPSQQQLTSDTSAIACPAGTTDLGVADGGFNGRHIPIRLCSITGTVCTGSDCRKGELGGKARGEVILNSVVAPHFIKWLTEVRAKGLNPTFASSFRAWNTQSGLWAGGSNGNAARPGYSNHQMGTAVDISGLPGSYNKGQCIGKAPDGGCMAAGSEWPVYHQIGLVNGAAFHDSEFWHLEWIITRPESRNLPFLKKEIGA